MKMISRGLAGIAVAFACVASIPSLVNAAPAAAPTVAAAAPAAHALTRDDVEAYLDGFFPDALARSDIAGAVVVVVKDGHVLLEKGYGFSDAAKRTPVDPQRTLFRPG